MNDKILCVDDDANILAGYQRNLRRQFTIETALGGEQGLALIDKQGPYAVIVADMQMPGMNGVEFLIAAQEKTPDTIRVMLTGNADQQTAVDAINQGRIFQFLNKPCSPEALAQALTAGLKQYRLITAEKELLEKTLSGSVKMLTEILSITEPQSFGRANMLRDYSRLVGKAMNLEEPWEIEVAAMLSQIGYVTIPAKVIQKLQGHLGLTKTEEDMLARLPEIGSHLLSHIPRLEPVARIVLFQNKRFDGSGFPPEAVSGDNIPHASRILKALADLIELEEMGTPKPKAIAQMLMRAGWYDPKVMEAIRVTLLDNETPPDDGRRAIKLRELRAGNILAAAIETGEGMVIVGAGTEISPVLLEKLHNFAQLSGIREPIYVSN